MEEAITSSQLEGAATTRAVAKEMLRSGRKPRDTSERMIVNNYLTMRRIMDLRSESLSEKLVFDIHRSVTADTLEKQDAAGRYRYENEEITVLTIRARFSIGRHLRLSCPSGWSRCATLPMGKLQASSFIQ